MGRYRECLSLASRSPLAWLVAGMFAVIVGGGLGLGIALPLLDRAPTTLLPSRVVSTVVKQGGYLEFTQTIGGNRRGRSCTGTISREFHRLVERDGNKLWQKWRSPLVGAALDIEGETEWSIVVPLLPDMPPGHWRMVGESTYSCWLVFGGTFRYRITPLDFEVVP